jgi:hypothetical protein
LVAVVWSANDPKWRVAAGLFVFVLQLQPLINEWNAVDSYPVFGSNRPQP